MKSFLVRDAFENPVFDFWPQNWDGYPYTPIQQPLGPLDWRTMFLGYATMLLLRYYAVYCNSAGLCRWEKYLLTTSLPPCFASSDPCKHSRSGKRRRYQE